MDLDVRIAEQLGDPTHAQFRLLVESVSDYAIFETYRARLIEKLGIRDVAGLVKFAIARGIVPLE